jgi:hypothetical protein
MNRELLAPEIFLKSNLDLDWKLNPDREKRPNSKVIMDLLPSNGEPIQIGKKSQTQKAQ